MKKILFFDLHMTQNDEYAQFQTEVLKLIMLQAAVKLGIVTLLPAYESAMELLAKAMQAELGSVITKTITESDAFRDQLEHGFALFTESKLYHYDPAVQAAADRVKRILDQYNDLRRLPYNKESSAITTRNQQLRSNYAADVETIGGTEWLSHDDAANVEFINHFGDRANEIAARISGNVRDARNKVLDAYEAIITRINALSEVNGDADYAEFIDKVNYYVGYYKDGIAARKGRKKVVAPAAPAK